tara:strand:- start:281 stop:532 length:252 start_codon:yes stop_codon:yes gene_type:complete
MGLFNKEQSVVSKHQLKSDATFKLFNDTLNNLTSSEEEIDIDINAATEESRLALERAKELEAIKTKGAKFRANLTKLINGDAI